MSRSINSLRILLWQLTILAGFSLLWATKSQSAEPIRIGTTQSLSGHYEEFGLEQFRGLQMWASDVNGRGALLGRPVELLHYDDRSRDAGSIEGYRQLIEKDGVDLLIGPYSSSLTLEASLVAEEHNIPMIATAASSEKIWSRGLKNIFGIDTPTGSYVSGLNVAAETGAKTISLVYANTEFPVEVARSVRDHASDLGLEIVMDQRYEPEERNFTELVKQLVVADADIVMGATYLEDSVAMVKEIRRQKLKPKMLVFTVGPALQEFFDELGSDAEGVVGIVQWLRSVPLPGAEDFAYRYRERYGYNPGVHAAIGYSAGQVLEAAVRLAGSTEHDAVREQLGSMFFRSLLGKYHVDETGRQIGHQNYLLQWQDSQRRLVAPANVAERKLIYTTP